MRCLTSFSSTDPTRYIMQSLSILYNLATTISQPGSVAVEGPNSLRHWENLHNPVVI